MINVNFTTCPTIDNLHSMDVMYCLVTLDDCEYELYAECRIPDDCDDLPSFDESAYPVLKDDIIGQAKEIGFDPHNLKFFWD